MAIEEGEIILGKVEKIAGTVIFITFQDPDTNEKYEGSMVFSEVSPGRIRNIRDYVFPGKQIACKILKKSEKGHIELSLRRVSLKEKKELKEKLKQEKSYKSILKSILGEKSKEVLKKIHEQKINVYDYLEDAKENKNKQKEIADIIGEKNLQGLMEILDKQKKNESVVKKEINLSSQNPNGLQLIKDILTEGKEEGVEIKYISAGKYSLKTKDPEIKKADQRLQRIISEIEKKAKKNEMEFSRIEKKK